MGLYTPTILGQNSYLSWFYDRGAIKDPGHTGTSKGLSQVINKGPIGKFLPKYANVYVTTQSHGLSASARTHYVTANGVWNGLIIWSAMYHKWYIPALSRNWKVTMFWERARPNDSSDVQPFHCPGLLNSLENNKGRRVSNKQLMEQMLVFRCDIYSCDSDSGCDSG